MNNRQLLNTSIHLVPWILHFLMALNLANLRSANHLFPAFSRIPDSIGKDIEKACQSIYPLHDVYVRKVKMLKKPKFECKPFSQE